MNKTILISIIIVILIVVIGGYFIYANQGLVYKITPEGETNNKINTNTPAAENQQQNQPENLNASVSIKNFAFNPTSLTIRAGTTVTWINDDTIPHQIKANTFDSAVLSNGQNFQFTFFIAGEYDYSCAIHPSMLGKIIVTQ